MGMTRKVLSISTLGMVDYWSDKERIARYTKQTRNQARKQTALMTAEKDARPLVGTTSGDFEFVQAHAVEQGDVVGLWPTEQRVTGVTRDPGDQMRIHTTGRTLKVNANALLRVKR